MTKIESSFSRRGPDIITEELVSVLLGGNAFDFAALFEIVLVKLRGCKSSRGGGEMLRLRAHEKLQWLVGEGMVHKTGKSYQANTLPLIAFNGRLKELRAKLAKL